MKIAAIYFGQPRFINNPYCFSTQEKKIFSQGKVDIYAHLWEPDTQSYDSSSWSGMDSCPSSQEDIKTFTELWKPKFLITEPNRRFVNDELYEKVKHKMPGEPEKKKRNFEISLSHFYSLEKAIELYEKNKETDYDWVVFLRTDLCVWEYPLIESLDKGYFYFSGIFHFEHFADLSYITDPKYVTGLKCYSFLTDPSFEESLIERANAESIKKATFTSKFTRDFLKQVPIPVRVVRSIDDIGKQW